MRSEVDKSLILNAIKSHLGYEKDVDFATFLGIKPQTLASWYSRNTFDIYLLYAKCININAHFLLTGEGDILRQTYSDGFVAPVLNPGSLDLGDRIKAVRMENSYNAAQFSEILKIDPSQYSKIESGKLAPTLNQCVDICSKFSLSMDWLIFGRSITNQETIYEAPETDYKQIAELALLNSSLLKELREKDKIIFDLEMKEKSTENKSADASLYYQGVAETESELKYKKT